MAFGSLDTKTVPLAVILVVSLAGGMPVGASAQNTFQNQQAHKKEYSIEIIENAAAGDWKTVREAIRDGTDPDVRGTDDQTALMAAASRGHVATVRVLLEAGATVDAQSKDGSTALMAAAEKGNGTVVSLLLEHDANLALTTSSEQEAGWTALTYAAKGGHALTVRQLLNAGADPDHRTGGGLTALGVALGHIVTSGDEKARYAAVARTLLKGGARPGLTDTKSAPPMLFQLMRHDAFVLARLVVEHGADPNVVDTTDAYSSEDWRPLGVALREGRGALLRALLKTGANPDQLGGEKEQTPLLLAIEEGNYHAVRLLLKAGADPNKRGEDGETPLMHAVQEERYRAVHLLLDAGAEVNARDDRGRTALMHVDMGISGSDQFVPTLAHSHMLVAEALLAAGVDPTLQDERGRTALDVANEERLEGFVYLLRSVVYEGEAGDSELADDPSSRALPRAVLYRDYDRFGALLEADVDLDVRYDTTFTIPSRSSDSTKIEIQDATPLMVASWLGHGLLVRRLLEAGSDPTLSPNGFMSPLASALRVGDVELARRFLEAGVNPNVDSGGHPPIVTAAARSPGLVDELLQNGADVNIRGAGGRTALHAAARGGSIDATKMLIDAGARVDRTDERGITPLMLAVEEEHPHIVELLLDAGADPTAQTNEGESVFRVARSRSVRRLLKSHGALSYRDLEDIERRYTEFQNLGREERYQKKVADTTTVYVDVDTPPTPNRKDALREYIAYPDLLRDAGITGEVVVRFVVDKTGALRHLTILQSDHDLLSREVRTGIRGASFSPGRLDGTPVPVRQIKRFSFPR